MENITIIINYKSLKDLILLIIIDYNCQKIIIIIRYNRLFTSKLGCGLFPEKKRFKQTRRGNLVVEDFEGEKNPPHILNGLPRMVCSIM